MTSSPTWPTIDHPHNPVADLLNQYGKSLQQQYPSLDGRLTIILQDDKPEYVLSFYLISHKLRGYNIRLLTIEQPIDSSFPVTLTMHYKTYSSPPRLLDEANFEPALRDELASPPIQNILNNLLALGNTVDEYRDDLNQSVG